MAIDSNGFEFRTERLSATFRDGILVALVNRQNGEVIADPTLMDHDIPSGLGALSGSVQTMDRFHTLWGHPKMRQHIPLGTPRPNYWHPQTESRFELHEEDGVVHARWIGLGNDEQFEPAALFNLTVWEDPESGALCFQSSAEFPQGGVYGVQIPIANLSPDSQFYLPHFGGMKFDRDMETGLIPLSGAPFYEAPLMALETATGSVGLWTENVHHPYHVFLNWSGRSFSFAFEHNALAPYESHQSIDSVTWKLDVFTNGGWTDAMTPFKEWYAATFAEELALRDSVDWARDIKVVIDVFLQNPKTYEEVAKRFDPSTVMFHFWNARAPRFDRELPDWTPREGYIDNIRQLKELGFRTQAYVNTYCINYNSPVFIRDQIAEFFLTRKVRKGRYAERPAGHQEDDATIGDAQGGFGLTGPAQFEGVQEGRLLYVDPLSSGWRKYHVEQMKWWNSTTGTDANYEDTAGTWGDYGNGVVEGRYAGQGAVAMMRDLVEGQPHVPMSTEYGPAPVAFGAHWSLVYSQVWGNDTFRKYRLHRQYPIGAFLYNYRAWVPVIRAESDFLMHLVAATSDALGGMGQTQGREQYLDIDRGMLGHLNWRSQVFSQHRLTPYFEAGRYPPPLISMYQGAEGGIYRYHDDGSFQQFISPEGSPLYGRARGIHKVETPLMLPGWPAHNANTVFGLNPHGASYAFFPKREKENTHLTVTRLPEDTWIDTYREQEEFALLVVKSDPAIQHGELEITLNQPFQELSVNGTRVALHEENTLQLSVEFPAYLLFSNTGNIPVVEEPIGNDSTLTHLVDQSGLTVFNYTTTGELMNRKHPSWGNQSFMNLSSLIGGEHTVDYLIQIPDHPDSALKIAFGNTASSNGDGTVFKVFLNGQLLKSHDCVTPNPEYGRRILGIDNPSPRFLYDTSGYEWYIPLAEYSGQNVLVTLVVDPKESTQSDSQWFRHPAFVHDNTQKLWTRPLNEK